MDGGSLSQLLLLRIRAGSGLQLSARRIHLINSAISLAPLPPSSHLFVLVAWDLFRSLLLSPVDASSVDCE